MEQAKKVETHAGHGVSQFELTTQIIKNLNKYDLTPTAKLVLILLTTHYNEEKNGAVVFPSMPYISETLGISLTATKQAIKDLVAQGLILQSKREKIRGNYNKYLLTQKVQNSTVERAENKPFKSTEKDLSFIRTNKENEIKEQNNVVLKNVSLEDYKILKNYAIKNGARNINAYINKLLSCGSEGDIIKAARQAKENSEARIKETAELLQRYEQEKQTACSPVEYTREQAIEYIKSMKPMFWTSGCCARLIQKYALQDMFCNV